MNCEIYDIDKYNVIQLTMHIFPKTFKCAKFYCLELIRTLFLMGPRGPSRTNVQEKSPALYRVKIYSEIVELIYFLLIFIPYRRYCHTVNSSEDAHITQYKQKRRNGIDQGKWRTLLLLPPQVQTEEEKQNLSREMEDTTTATTCTLKHTKPFTQPITVY